MSAPRIPLVTHETYHVFNRGLDKRPTFRNQREYARAYQTLKYYRFLNLPVKLSRFLELNEGQRQKIMQECSSQLKISILAYCFMPNHFHFLIRQEADNGISKFMSDFLNSYTKYFNTKEGRVGQLFLNNFKSVRVESEEQLLHLSRYIHLNPFSSFVVKEIEDLEKYEWSSFQEYLQKSEDYICEKETILSYFKNTERYKQFVLDRADYQRELKRIEHLTLED